MAVLKRQVGLATAILVIVADMIGTGVFMTTGNVLDMTGSAPVVMALWIIGGCIAIAGALCYSELAATWPDVGGEYVYLKKIFGFLPAFLTGWVSLVVGFAAPVATSSLLLVQYISRFLHAVSGTPGEIMLPDDVWFQKTAAVAIIVFFGGLHIVGVKKGSYVQNVLTIVKIMIVAALIVLGLFAADFDKIGRLAAGYPAAGPGASGFAAMGLGLLVVMFAYSGWNSASYIAGEIRSPERNLPRAMLWGTLLTMCLYLLLNFVFLIAAPGEALMGKDEVAAIAAGFLFSPALSNFLTLGIAIILLSAVSVQMMIGPRVCYAMAQDRMLFHWLATLHPRYGTPWLAVCVQMGLAIIYVVWGSAMTLVIYMGFALSVFPVLAVIGMMYMRFRQPGLPRAYRVPLYPYVPLLYIVLSVAMMTAALMAWTTTSLFSIGVLLAGIPVYYLWRFFVK